MPRELRNKASEKNQTGQKFPILVSKSPRSCGWWCLRLNVSQWIFDATSLGMRWLHSTNLLSPSKIWLQAILVCSRWFWEWRSSCLRLTGFCSGSNSMRCGIHLEVHGSYNCSWSADVTVSQMLSFKSLFYEQRRNLTRHLLPLEILK